MISIEGVYSQVDPVWRGRRCFIIAGGPSAFGAPDLIRQHFREGDKILAVKHAGMIFPEADVLFWAGKKWHHETAARPVLAGMSRDTVFIKRSIHAVLTVNGKTVHELERIPGGDGLASNPWQLGGWDAGGSALNLAYHLEPAEIILFGLDYGGRHWLGDHHPRPNEKQELHALHCSGVEAMAPALAAAGRKVFNASKVSRLQCFPQWEA